MPDVAEWRVVIAGAGLMGRWHAHALQRVGARVLAVADPDPDRRAILARHAGAIGVASLAEGLSLSAAPDAVHVCAPLDTHASLVREALEHGCHVLVEKPAAPTAGVTRDLLDLATARARFLCPVHQFLYQDGVQAVLARLPALGDVRHLDYVACTAGADAGDASVRRAVATEVLPHPLSLAGRILKRPLASARWSVQEPLPGELRATTALDGVGLNLLVSTRGRPTRNTLRVIAQHGTAHLDLFHGFAVVERGGVSRTGKILRPFALSAATLGRAGTHLLRRVARREPAYPGLRKLIRRFVMAARAGASPPISASETLDVALSMENIRGAAI